MAKDAELERLKAAQDTAFTRKQDAYDRQESAWKARAAARETMNSAFEAKQRAYDVQQRSWEDLSRLRDREGPRIEQLNRLQEQAYQNMKDSFDQATSAHNHRDGAAAAMYARQGHEYKAESQRHVTERRGIISTLKGEADRHATLKPAFDAAKDRFNAAKREHDRAKAVHERAQAEFKTAKANFDKAAKDFKARLEVLKKETGKRNEDKRSIAEKAGVPYQYRDKVYVSKGANGITNIYFGGVGEPNGPGHAHYVMDASGKVTYKREPFDPHGEQNFEGPGKDGHRGGFGKPKHGWIGDAAVTFALGWGTKQNHTLIADGHLSAEHFRDSRHHDHYGPGDGPRNNGTLRGTYTGPGA